MITLHRVKAGGRDYYQVVLTRPGVEIQSPLLSKEGAVEWIKWALNYLPTESSPSLQKAG